MTIFARISFLLSLISALMISWTNGKKDQLIEPTQNTTKGSETFPPNNGELKVNLVFLKTQDKNTEDIFNELKSAFKLSVGLINKEAQQRGSIIRFTYTLRNISKQCSPNDVRELINSTAVGIIGPSQTACAQLISQNQVGENLTYISYLPISYRQPDKSPGLLSVCPNRNRQAQALAAIIKHYEWESIIIIEGKNAGSMGLETQNEIESLDVSVDQIIHLDLRIIDKQLHEVKKSSARVVVMLVDETTEQEKVLQKAFEKGLLAKGWYWLVMDSLTLTDIKEFAHLGEEMQGILGIYPRSGSGPIYHRLLSEWLSKNEHSYPGKIWKTKFDNSVGAFVPQVYDAVYAYYKALQSLVELTVIKQGTPKKVIRKAVLSEVKRYINLSRSFIGATDEAIYFDPETSDGPPMYDVVNLQDKSWRKVGWYGHDGLSISRLVVWPGGNMNPRYSAQFKAARSYEELAVVMAVVMTIFLIMAVVLYRMVLRHRDKEGKLKIAYKQLISDNYCTDKQHLTINCGELNNGEVKRETNL